MNSADLVSLIERDLQKAAGGKVVYLEGQSDFDIFPALIRLKLDGIAESGVLLTEYRVLLKSKGSKSSVRNAVVAARDLGYVNVHGIIDSDGAHPTDPVQPGLHCLNCYCIENYLPRTSWPSGWGSIPDWTSELKIYAPYVAFAKAMKEFRRLVHHHDLLKSSPTPTRGKPLADMNSFKNALTGLVTSLTGPEREDILELFHEAYNSMIAVLDQHNIEKAHQLINGKWIVGHFAPEKTGKSQENCRNEWIEECRSIGNPDLLSLWQSIINT